MPSHDDFVPRPQKSWWGRNWVWVVPSGCLGCLLLPAGCLAGLAFLAAGLFSGSEPYTLAVERARAHPRVIELLGEPIEVGWMIQGSVRVDESDGTADFSLPLSGPNGSARLHVEGEKHDGVWEYDRMEVEIEATGEWIDLLPSDGERWPDPSGTDASGDATAGARFARPEERRFP